MTFSYTDPPTNSFLRGNAEVCGAKTQTRNVGNTDDIEDDKDLWEESGAGKVGKLQREEAGWAMTGAGGMGQVERPASCLVPVTECLVMIIGKTKHRTGKRLFFFLGSKEANDYNIGHDKHLENS